ncbi:SHOCT domain-containing protein [Siminovitchia sp. FSL H7-0308]|uniref:SHOCT domain-containing protein n=1 Tax=Siminovitchia sp. FSL H7-0308 TaxID=2921432 RepID=UPI0030ED4865
MRVKQHKAKNTSAMKMKHEITHEQLQNEFDYYYSEGLLMKILENNLITKEEFNKINELNRQKFKPLLGPLMCDNP